MKKIICGLMIFIVFIMLTACGKNNSMIGSYQLIEMTKEEEIYTKKMINQLGLKIELIIKDDNNAILDFSGEERNLTYDDKEFIDIDEEQKIPYIKENNKITIQMDNEKMVFEK